MGHCSNTNVLETILPPLQGSIRVILNFLRILDKMEKVDYMFFTYRGKKHVPF